VCVWIQERKGNFLFLFIYLFIYFIYHVIFRIYSEKSISIDKELKDAKTGKKREREREKA
jgi:F0F1-type ATP synthase membrane subunit b/b'